MDCGTGSGLEDSHSWNNLAVQIHELTHNPAGVVWFLLNGWLLIEAFDSNSLWKEDYTELLRRFILTNLRFKLKFQNLS